MIGLDTTVLVAYEIREAPGHAAVRHHLQAASRAGTGHYALAPQVLQEFLHVVTDPRRFEIPLDFPGALARARHWWESAEVVPCHPADAAMAQTLAWLDEFRLGRKRTLDTALAATYHAAGVSTLATANPGDFTVFGVFTFAPWAVHEA